MKGKDLKKTIAKLLLCTVLLTGASLQKMHAQSPVGYLGLSVAPMYTNLSSDRAKLNWVLGGAAGLSPEVKFGENMGVELDLLYSMKGTDRNYLDSINYYDRNYYYKYNNVQYTMGWAEAHLLFKYYWHIDHNPVIPYDAPGHHSFFYVLGGPYYSYMLNYSTSGNYETWGMPYGNTKDTIIGSYRKISKSNGLTDSAGLVNHEIGITLGAGLSFDVGKSSNFSIEARFSHGITSIDNGEFGHFVTGKDTKNASLNAVFVVPAGVVTESASLFISYKFKIFGGGN